MDLCLSHTRIRLGEFSLVAAIGILATVSLLPSSLQAQNFLIEYSDEKLSVQGNNIQIKDLLREIQDKTGIKVNFIADPKDTVSLDVKDQSVESVIAKITENHMIIHDNVNGKKTISELIIISDDPDLNSTSGGSANLPSGEPAPIIPTESIEDSIGSTGTESPIAPSDDPANQDSPKSDSN